MTFWYRLCWWICRIGLFFWHPVLHVHGRELVPAGCALLCANHSGMRGPDLDACWRSSSPKMMPDSWRKKSCGACPYRRLGDGEVRHHLRPTAARIRRTAYKESTEALGSGETSCWCSSEGTRVQRRQARRARRPARSRWRWRADAPVVPVYMTRNRTPFCPIDVYFGEPYYIENSAQSDARRACQHGGGRDAGDDLQAGRRRTMQIISGEDSGLLLRG